MKNKAALLAAIAHTQMMGGDLPVKNPYEGLGLEKYINYFPRLSSPIFIPKTHTIATPAMQKRAKARRKNKKLRPNSYK